MLIQIIFIALGLWMLKAGYAVIFAGIDTIVDAIQEIVEWFGRD